MELLPVLRQRFLDANGLPLAGGKLYSYLAGTSTPRATYTDRGGSTSNANPIILDANGYADVWINTGYFKFVLTDASDVAIWTVDQVGIPSGGSTSLPTGGSTGQVLGKLSGADFDYGWLNVAATLLSIVGTRAAPTNIVAASGIAFSSITLMTTNFIQGSGGAVIVTATPQIQAGTVVGQILKLIGRSDANTVTLADGNGLSTGGQTLILGANTIFTFVWDGTVWVLDSTNGFAV